MRSVHAMVMLGLAVAAWLPQLASVSATPAGTNGTIIFSARPAGELIHQLYTMMPDGTLQQPLCPSQPGSTSGAQFSPDGKRIAFESHGDIFVMNADCTGLSNITNIAGFDEHPSWSPDGTRIVFKSSRTGGHEIWSMAPDGTELVQLTNTGSPLTNDDPVYSPDGTRIAFVSRRAGFDAIWVMHADGSAPRRLTDAPNISNTFMQSPDWSPDGSLLAFVSGAAMPGASVSGVDVMMADGSERRDLTSGAVVRTARSPAWSPDGTSVVFAGSTTEPGSKILVINADRTNLRVLAGPPAGYEDVSWRSDNPICEIEMSQQAYANGDVLTAQSVRIANPGLVPVPVELKLWFEPAGFAAVPLINTGADGTMMLPAGLDQELGPAPMFTVTSAHPRGFSQLGCRVLDPSTGAVRYADVNRFAIK